MLRRSVFLACALALALPVALPTLPLITMAQAAETKEFTPGCLWKQPRRPVGQSWLT